MQAQDLQVLARLREWLTDGRRAYLCTITGTYGSSPRPIGSLMACSDRGEMIGSLSGGCVEDDLLESLRSGDLVTQTPQRLSYGLQASDTERLGLPCGGSLEIVVEQLDPGRELIDHFTRIIDALDARRCIQRTVALASNLAPTLEDVTHYRTPCVEEDSTGSARLVHTYGPRRQLFLIGAGMVSRFLADMAMALDFDVTVCDPRHTMIEQWTLAGVRTVCAMPDDAIREQASDARTAIIALTHVPRIDDMGLLEALETEAFYVGAMGSMTTSNARRARLKALDVSAAAIARLHAPVGIAIGSKTPAEIAISILAELTREIRDADAATVS